MQVYAWTVFPLLLFGIWWLKYFIAHRTKPTKPKMWESHGETCRQILNHTSENKFQPRTPISIGPILITFHQTEHILVPMPCCMFLKTMRPWLRWSSQAEVPRWDMFQGPTELFWIGCLTESMWTPKSKSVTFDSKHQIADILLKGNFTRDDWNHLLCLFNMSQFSSLRCTNSFSVISCNMAKIIQEQEEEERVVSKSRPAVMKMSSYLISSSSSAASSPIASESSGTSGASWRPGSKMHIAASSCGEASVSQVKLKDAYFGGFKEKQQGDLPHERQGNQEKLMISNLNDGKKSLLLKIMKLAGNHLQEDQQNSCLQNSRKVTAMKWRIWITSLPYRHITSFTWMTSTTWSEKSTQDQRTIPWKIWNVNMATWWIFMNATLREAIHLGNDRDVNLRNVQNSTLRTVGQFFGDIEKLISGQTESAGINLIDSQDLRWISAGLLHSRAHRYATGKVYVFSDSVLCLGRMEDDPTNLGRTILSGIQRPTSSANWNRIDGKPMEFEWKILPGLETEATSKKFRIRWANYSVIQPISKTGTSSCQCSTTLMNGMQEEMKNYAKSFRKVLQNTLDNFLAVIGLSWGLDPRKSGAELTMAYQVDIGRKQWRKCCWTLRNLVILRSVAPVPWKEDNEEANWEERQLYNSHRVKRFTVASENGHVRQSLQSLRSNGGYDSRITGKPSSSRETGCIRSDGTRNSYSTSCCRSTIQWRATGKPLARLRAKILKTSRRPETIKIMLRSRFEFGGSWTILLCCSITERTEDPIFYAENMHYLEKAKRTNCAKGWIRSNERFGRVLEVKVCKTIRGYSVEVWIPSLFEDQTTSWIKNCEWCRKICQRSNADPRRRRSFGETRCKGQTKIEAGINKQSEFHSDEG